VPRLRSSDILWVAAAPLVGLAYVVPLWLSTASIQEGFNHALFTMQWGDTDLSLGVFACVYLSYAWLADGEHTLATYARLWGDGPRYASLVRRSFAFFALGPVLLLASAILARALPELPLESAVTGVFLVVFQLWGFFHINRQHFGFYGMYRSREGGSVDRMEWWLVHGLLFLPVGLLMTHPDLADLPGLPPALVTWLEHASGTRPFVQAALVVLLGIWVQRELWRASLFQARSLLLLGALGMHVLVFSDLRLAVCMTPIIGLGHCVQYHFIVYRHGQRQKAAPAIFRSPFWFYGALVLLSFCLYRGPLTEWAFWALGERGSGTTTFTALQHPETLGLGQRMFGLFLMGWGLQHYFLDGFIWRKRRDPRLASALEAA
jgi:hypothetical protein